MSGYKSVRVGCSVLLTAGLFLAPVIHSAAGGKKPQYNIVDAAASAEHFDTLVTMLAVTGLDDTLREKGPYTLFAPPDTAFEKLPAGSLARLLMDENLDMLKKIVSFHLVPRELKSTKIRQMNSARTLNGQRLSFSVRKQALMIDNARVIQADIPCKNGFIHVVDRILLPRIELPPSE